MPTLGPASSAMKVTRSGPEAPPERRRQKNPYWWPGCGTIGLILRSYVQAPGKLLAPLYSEPSGRGPCSRPRRAYCQVRAARSGQPFGKARSGRDIGEARVSPRKGSGRGGEWYEALSLVSQGL